MTDLGTLGGDIAFPSQITAANIVGGSITAADLENAFFTSNTSGLMDLPGLGGGNAVAFGVNAGDNAAGISYLLDHTTEHAVAWEQGKPIDLGTLPGGDYSEAFGINAANLVVGNSTTTVKGYSYRAFVWQSVDGIGAMAGIGLLPGGGYSLFNAINSNGLAVGSADTVIGAGKAAVAGEHAILWDVVHGLQDLGTLGGRSSVARGINVATQVVGASDTALGEQHAFLWDSAHGMQDLGVLPDYDSTSANSINDSGQVAGNAYDTGTHRFSGFVWDRVNGMRDVNTLVPPGLGLHLSNVVNNNQGWLVAAGNDGSGHQSVVLLVPEP